jgi:hypothetical protein
MTESFLPFWFIGTVAVLIGGCAVYLAAKGLVSAAKGTRDGLIWAAYYLLPAGILLIIAAKVAS